MYSYTIKRYSDTEYKLTVYRPYKSPIKDKKDFTAYNGKLKNSISRGKNMVFDYSYCNDFDYFITLTLDPKKYKRDDLKKYIKDLGQMIRDYRKLGNDIEYILIPERHKDGESWHMHGLIKGIAEKDLTINENGYLDWGRYSKKFGYCSLSKIKNREAVSKYITKYISKDLYKNGVTDKNAKMYYCSRGLQKPKKLQTGDLSIRNFKKINYDFVLTQDTNIGIPMFLSAIKNLDKNQLKEILKMLE